MNKLPLTYKSRIFFSKSFLILLFLVNGAFWAHGGTVHPVANSPNIMTTEIVSISPSFLPITTIMFLLSDEYGSGTYALCQSAVQHLNSLQQTRYTVLRGSLIEDNGTDRRFLDLSLSVIDKKSGKRLEHVFLPVTEQGHYYVILEPGRHYDLFFEVPGYKPHIVTIAIPKQRFFYPLYQQVDLTPVRMGSNRIGQHIRIRNTFFDIHKASEKRQERSYIQSGGLLFDKVQEIVALLVAEKDTLDTERLNARNDTEVHLNAVRSGKNYSNLLLKLRKAIIETDSLAVMALANSTLKEKVFERLFLYNDKAPYSQLQEYEIGGLKIASLPPIKAYDDDNLTCTTTNVLQVRYTDLSKYDVHKHKALPVELWRLDTETNASVFRSHLQRLIDDYCTRYPQRTIKALVRSVGKEAHADRYIHLIKEIFQEKCYIELGQDLLKLSTFEVNTFEYDLFARGFSKSAIEVLILNPIE